MQNMIPQDERKGKVMVNQYDSMKHLLNHYHSRGGDRGRVLPYLPSSVINDFF